MLQNRVDPAGNILVHPARGQWMGNRGCIHNQQQQIAKPFAIHAWITCRLSYKDQRLPLMSGQHNTQLFFLDEVTALAAGHRPCAFCRREAYTLFKWYWLLSNPAAGFTRSTTIKSIDDYMHAGRIGKDRKKITYWSPLADLPSGSFVQFKGAPLLYHSSKLYPWTAAGYEAPVPVSPAEEMEVLTPRSIVHTLKAGYQPQVALTG